MAEVPYLPWDPAEATALAEALKHLDGACLPILHALQKNYGYIHPEAVPIVAETLNLSKAEVVGVVNFYSDFKQEPPARHVIKVCLAEACQSMGSARVVEELRATLGIGVGEAKPDGSCAIEAVYCLGNCALSPAIMVDEQLHGRVTAGRVAALVGGVAQ